MMKSVKNIFFATLLFVACSYSAFSESKVIEKSLSNGIPVYYMENNTNKIDAVLIGVKGGTKYYTPEMSGIENATFLMLGKGSENYSYKDLQSIKYKTSASVTVSSSYYGSWISLNSIDEYLDSTLPMLLDGFVNPTFEYSEYEKIMNDYGNSVQQTLNDPYSLARYYASKLIYQNHPYETYSSVIPESIDNISLTAIRQYYLSLLDSRRIYVIAVTKKPVEELLPVFEDYLGSIPAGLDPLLEEEIPEVSVAGEPMVFTHQSIAGSGHIFRAFNAPSNTSDEYIPLVIADTIYGQILHNVVRAKYGSCYSVWSENYGRESNVGFEVVYRCSDFTDIKKQIAEARQIMSDGKYIVSTKADGSFVLGNLKDTFEGFRNSVINSMYEAEMTTYSRAAMLNSSLLMWNNTNGLDNQRAMLNTVTVEQVLEVFNKYFNTQKEFWFAVVGPDDEEKVLEILSE